jgi:hypothetical protein
MTAVGTASARSCCDVGVRAVPHPDGAAAGATRSSNDGRRARERDACDEGALKGGGGGLDASNEWALGGGRGGRVLDVG